MHIKRKQNIVKKINWRTTICLLVAICLFFVLGYLVIDYKYNSLPQQKEIEIIKLIEQRQQSLSEEELVGDCLTLWYGHNIPYPGNSKIYERLRDRIKRDAENKICSLSESGNAHAAYNHGIILEDRGDKCEDKEKSNDYYRHAAYWFKLSADSGNNSNAASRLAEYYLYGRGIPKDEYLSFQYARLAATHNNPKGYLLVGNFFYDGVIQEYEWQKDSTCYYCVRKKECPTHMHKVNRVLVSNNIDSARLYWEKTIDNSPKGPLPGSHPKFEAIQRLKEFIKGKNKHVTMTIEDIKAMIAADESRTLELKKSTGELKDGMHAACAFLNTEGGWLIFGITPKSLKIVGQQAASKE